MVYVHNNWGKSNNIYVFKANLEKKYNKMPGYYLWINVFDKIWIL